MSQMTVRVVPFRSTLQSSKTLSTTVPRKKVKSVAKGEDLPAMHLLGRVRLIARDRLPAPTRAEALNLRGRIPRRLRSAARQ